MNSFEIPIEILNFFDYLEKKYGKDEKFLNSKKPINNIFKIYKQLLEKPDIENEDLRKIATLHYLISF